jgi:hypothetical protein
VQAWADFIGVGVKLVTGRAVLEVGFAARGVAFGMRGCDQKCGDEGARR